MKFYVLSPSFHLRQLRELGAFIRRPDLGYRRLSGVGERVSSTAVLLLMKLVATVLVIGSLTMVYQPQALAGGHALD